MRVSSDVFDAVLLTACRASVLLATTSGDETVGIDKASQFEEAANVASGALVAFLFDGPSEGNA